MRGQGRPVIKPLVLAWRNTLARHDAFHLRMAAHAIAAGGVIAHPTEGVWGLACDPFDWRAVARVLALKSRPADKGLLLLADGLEQVAELVGPLSDAEAQRLQKTASHPVTWVVPATHLAPEWVRGAHTTLALRLTRHDQCRALLQAWGGPLVSTSANPAGCKPAANALRVRTYFGRAIDYLLPGPLGDAAGPSEIRDLRTGQVIRGAG